MNALVPAVAAALIIVGLLVFRSGLRPPPDRSALPDRRRLLRRRVTRKQLVMAGFGLAAGVIAWVVLRARRWLRTRRSMPTASTVSPLSATHETQPAYPGAPVAHPRMPAPAPSGAGSAGEAPVPEHS